MCSPWYKVGYALVTGETHHARGVPTPMNNVEDLDFVEGIAVPAELELDDSERLPANRSVRILGVMNKNMGAGAK